jgi:hypothetical protein
VPLVDVEVLVEVVGQRVPRNELPAHALLQVLDLLLGGARGVDERRVARVEVRGVRDLVGDHRATHAGPFRVGAARLREGGDVRRVEGAVDDQLAAPVEQVEQAHRAVGALEAVVLLHGHPRHPPALGGQRIAGAEHLLLLHEQLLALGGPLLRRNDL